MFLDVVLIALAGYHLDQQTERCVIPIGVLKGGPGIVCELDVGGSGYLTLQRIVTRVGVEHVVHARRCRDSADLIQQLPDGNALYASGSATRNRGRYCCTGASSSTLPASTSCMTANAVNDLLIDPILKGVVTVT